MTQILLPPLISHHARSLTAVSVSTGSSITRAAFSATLDRDTGDLLLEAGISSLCRVDAQDAPCFDETLLTAELGDAEPGLAITMWLHAVGALCGPIPGARVDIWHCGAGGTSARHFDDTEQVRGETDAAFSHHGWYSGDDGALGFETLPSAHAGLRATHVRFSALVRDTSRRDPEVLLSDRQNGSVSNQFASARPKAQAIARAA